VRALKLTPDAVKYTLASRGSNTTWSATQIGVLKALTAPGDVAKIYCADQRIVYAERPPFKCDARCLWLTSQIRLVP
jgi:hypothetical protein